MSRLFKRHVTLFVDNMKQLGFRVPEFHPDYESGRIWLSVITDNRNRNYDTLDAKLLRAHLKTFGLVIPKRNQIYATYYSDTFPGRKYYPIRKHFAVEEKHK